MSNVSNSFENDDKTQGEKRFCLCCGIEKANKSFYPGNLMVSIECLITLINDKNTQSFCLFCCCDQSNLSRHNSRFHPECKKSDVNNQIIQYHSLHYTTYSNSHLIPPTLTVPFDQEKSKYINSRYSKAVSKSNGTDEEKYCVCCGKMKPLNAFNKNTPTECKQCNLDKGLGFISKLIAHCSATQEKNQRKGSFDLTYEVVNELIEEYGGRCAITRVPFYLRSLSAVGLSINRKNDDYTYCTKVTIDEKQFSNIEPVLLLVQHAAGWTRESWHMVYKRRNDVAPLFKSGISNSDKVHHNALINENLKRFVNISKFHINERNDVRDGDKRKKLDHCIDLDYLWKIYNTQKGKCAISGGPMLYGIVLKELSVFKMSINRINNDLGYVVDNIQLVCFGFNSTDMTHIAVNESHHGLPQDWSPLISQYMFEQLENDIRDIDPINLDDWLVLKNIK